MSNSSSTATITKVTQSAPASTAANPPRGSYAQMLARAKAEQEERQDVGAIKHKKIEKVSKKDKEKQEKEKQVKETELKNKTLQGKSRRNGVNEAASRISHIANGRQTKPITEERKRKPIELGYQGTMRSSAPESTYKGATSQGAQKSSRKAGVNPQQRDRVTDQGDHINSYGSSGKKPRMAGYASYSESDLAEDDYESDQSSDMEAAAFEVDEEEELSLRVAKKEDELALLEENEHKRRKEARKRALMQMAADREKKKTTRRF